MNGAREQSPLLRASSIADHAAGSESCNRLSAPDPDLTRVLYDWNETEAEFPGDRCIHELFEQQASKSPDAIAVEFRRAAISYAELNRRANQLAHHLKSLGVVPESRVAVCLDRGVEMVVALLAVLKAGGAYVPLDPSYPEARLHLMVSDCVPVALLSQTEYMEHFVPGVRSVPIVDVSAHHAEWSSSPETAVSCESIGLEASNLAYIIYTSGSTGQPKGVMIEHRSVVNRIVWMQREYGLTSSDGVLQKTPFSFDVSVWEFFWPLSCGAKLVMAEPDGHKSAAELAEIIRAGGITTIHFVPSMLQVFLEHEAASQCASLVRVMASGEALPVATVKQFYQVLPKATLYNLYGPTETTVDVTAWKCDPALSRSTVPIGKPIANTRIYILDESGRPVPVGETGELFIGGVGVGRGYINRPEPTAERFRLDPFAKTRFPFEGEPRMYKSGDLCRWLPDGNIEYLGRNDFQVKLRGFRIELGEIEHEIAAQLGVRKAAVIARETKPGDKRLIAYLVLAPDARLTEREVAESLGQSLPGYMLPADFVVLDDFPVTANGKLDRGALPDPDQNNRLRAKESAASNTDNQRPTVWRGEIFAGVPYVAATDSLEAKLIEIWEEMLSVSPIGICDDFFNIGGHSLHAARVFARIQQVFSKSLPLAILFRAQTIAKLAQVIREEGWEPHWSVLVPIHEKGGKPPLFLVHGITGNVLNFYGLQHYMPSDQRLYGIQAYGLNSGQALYASIPEMASHYIGEIRTLQPTGPYFLGGFSAGGLIAYEMAQQLRAAGEEIRFLALIDTYVELAGGHWLKSFYDKGAFRMSLIRLRRNLLFVRENGLLQYLRVKAEGFSGYFRILLWSLGMKGKRGNSTYPTPQDLDPQNAFTRGIHTYSPKPYPGSAVLFRSLLPDNFDPPDGWTRLISGNLEVKTIQGSHREMFREPHIQTLARQLTEALDEAYRKPAEPMHSSPVEVLGPQS